MNRLMYALIIACLFTACSIFKRQFKNKSERSSVATILSGHEEKNNIQENKLLVIRDSLQEDLIVEIIPDGIFSYSIKEGFKGTGLSIKMKGKRNGRLEILKKDELATNAQQLDYKAIQERETEIVDKRGRFKLDINFSYVLTGLIGIGLLWLWWKYR